VGHEEDGLLRPRQERIQIRNNPFNPEWVEKSGYQIAQSLFAQADGGLFGTGFGASLLRGPNGETLIPAPHTDLIYGFGNEVALMADRLGLDAYELIESANLRYPRPDLSRPGYVGGSCLTKDPYLLLRAARQAGHHLPMVAAARNVNESLPHYAVERTLRALETAGKVPGDVTAAVAGIAYKGRPETDDVRGAASGPVAEALRSQIASLRGHDFLVPSETIAGLGFEPTELDEGLRGADALIMLTDHPGYQELDAERLLTLMAPDPVVFDMWGSLHSKLAGVPGLTYLGLGRG